MPSPRGLPKPSQTKSEEDVADDGDMFEDEDVLWEGGGRPGTYVIGSIEDLDPELRREAKQDLAEARLKGYKEVPESEINFFKAFTVRVMSLEEAEGRMDFKPVSLKETPFEHFTFEGVILEATDQNGRSDWFSRVFTMGDGTIVKLSEHDFVVNKGGGMIPQEFLNNVVNGYPASLSVGQTKGGDAISGLLWITSRKEYELSMTGNVRTNGRYDEFMALARSIPEEPSSGHPETKEQQTPIGPFSE